MMLSQPLPSYSSLTKKFIIVSSLVLLQMTIINSFTIQQPWKIVSHFHGHGDDHNIRNNVLKETSLPIEEGDKQLQQSSLSSSSLATKQQSMTIQKTFPVLHQISGKEWNGHCRYVNSELKPTLNLKLVGGLRYDLNCDDDDLNDKNNSDGESCICTCTLSSFLTFPNGQTREVVMKGTKDSDNNDNKNNNVIILNSTAPNGGPIYMILSEVPPDTVLINEVQKATGKVIMTSSLSIVDNGQELVQISHELDDDVTIEGHQVWRLKQLPMEYDDFATRDTIRR